MASETLPRESVSQKVGHEAKQAFFGHHPTCWRPSDLSGDCDVGLDFLIQVVNDATYERAFHVQLKGCAQKDEEGKCTRLNRERTHYSQELEVSTLNYYIQIDVPVMLVFVDLTQHESPRHCGAYYLWMDGELQRLRGNNTNLNHLGKASHTFHIPIENALDETLNVLPYLRNVGDRSRALSGLFDCVARQTPDVIPTIETLGKKVSNPTVLASVLHETENPWVDAPPDTNAWHLNQAANYVKANNAGLVKTELDIVARNLPQLSAHEKAEYYHLLSANSFHQGDTEGAMESAQMAAEIYPSADKYRLAYLEQLVASHCGDEKILRQTLSSTDNQAKLSYIKLRSKILALLGDPKSLELLNAYPAKDVGVVRCLVRFLLKDYDGCSVACSDALADPSFSVSQRITLQVLRSKALFYRGFAACNTTGMIPFVGLPGMDEGTLRICWEATLSAWKMGQMLNYPSDLAYIMDASSILGIYFNEIDKIYGQMKAFADSHISMTEVQEVLLSVASSLEDYETAKIQLGRVRQTPETLVAGIFNEYRKGHRKNVVDLTVRHLDTLVSTHTLNLDITLLAAAECADDLGMGSERDTILARAKEAENADIILTLFSFCAALKKSAFAKDDAVDELYAYFEKGCHHPQLLSQLLQHLDPRRELGATRITQVADAICTQRQLTRDEILALCEALSTLHEWDKMVSLLNDASKRFPQDSRVLSAKAMALDNQGNTPEALQILSAVSPQTDDRHVLEMYANICARCGFAERAEETVFRLLEAAVDRERKLHCYRLLFVLEMRRDRLSPRLVDYSNKYGALVDPTKEEEEGMYFQLSFMAYMSGRAKRDKEAESEFQRRIHEFTKRWPESRYLRAVNCPVDDAPDVLLDRLREAAGLTDSALTRYRRAENLLKFGTPAPFAVRPRVLLNVCDVLHLWELSKVSYVDQRQYHLVLEAGMYAYKPTAEWSAKMPLLDEITLLVLNDLGILPHLFLVFDKIAVPRSAIARLQNWCNHFISSFSATAEAITNELRSHIDRILQPSHASSSLRDVAWPEIEECREIISSNPDMVFFSDDAPARCIVYGDDYKSKGATSLDFLTLLQDRGILSPLAVSQKIMMLCRWHVGGIQVRWIDILRVISPNIQSDDDVHKVLSKLASHDDFQSGIGYIWAYGKPYPDCLGDVASFVSTMLVRKDGLDVSDAVIAAIWYTWYCKVCLKRNGEQSRMGYLARSFWKIAASTLVHLRGRETADLAMPFRAWSLYKSLVQLVFGREMTEQVYDAALHRVAEFSVQTEAPLRDAVCAFLKAGLGEGTRDYELFDRTYVEAAIRRELRRGRA
jgi:tetratricopeptide (TPR) repeat protein